MTDFVRIPGKIFAENASPVGNNPEIGKFGNAKQGIYTGEADVREIQNSEAWLQGWTEAVVSAMNFPPLPEMNGVLKVLSYQICYLLQKGIPEWNADTIYYKNDYVNYNGKLYYSDIDNNTFEPETPDASNSWLSGTSDVAIATNETNGISRPDDKTLSISDDGVLSVNGLNNPYTLFDYKYSEYPLYNASWLLSNGNFYLKSIYVTAYEALVIEQDSTKTVGTTYPLPSGGNYIKRGLSVKLSTDEVGKGYKNMTFQGNLTIKNNIASNFSKDNFVEVPNPREEINSLIIDCIVTMPEEEPSESLHMIYGQKTTNITSPQVQLSQTPKKIQWLLPQKDGTWKDDYIYTEPVEWGKTYRIVMDYKDGVLKGYYAKEGEELKLAGTQEYPEGISWTEPLCFGKDINSVYQGKIDLSSIKIEVNDKFYAGYYDGISDYDFVLNTQNETFRLPIKAGINYAERYLIEAGSNYRIYSDGWCEQWGTVPSGNDNLNYTSTLSKPYKDTNYSVGWIGLKNNTSTTGSQWQYLKIYPIDNKTISTPQINFERGWRTWGYLANAPSPPTSFLYYYIGESIQSLSTIQAQANVILEELSKKISTDLMKAYIIETYINGTSGYRLWSDGWCEQWGWYTIPTSGSALMSFLKTFADTNYSFYLTKSSSDSSTWNVMTYIPDNTVSSFRVKANLTGYQLSGYWKACGYIAEGEY